MQKYISYYRVSTKKQGLSGLGLASQTEIVKNFIGSTGLLIKEFTEIESGKKNNRIELKKALELCKKENAKLVIAKLDRLSRNINFITSLMESKVNFVAVDMPDANNFTIHIFAALAEQERKMISERTKKGLEQARKKGKTLGKPENLTKEAIKKGLNTRIKNSIENENNTKVYFAIKDKINNGVNWSNLAKELNKAGFLSARGKSLQAVQVQRIYNKYLLQYPN